MQKRYETTSLTKADEKKIISDMTFLKKSIPNAEKLLTLKPEIDKLYDRKKAIREELNKFKDDIQVRESEIEGVRK